MKLARLVLTFLLLLKFALTNEADDQEKSYIIYMGQLHQVNTESVIATNHEILGSLLGGISEGTNKVIHHYHKSFRGFSAKLTTRQARKLAENDQIVSIFESKMRHICTTRSWKFLGVNSITNYSSLPAFGTHSNVIVGMLDTGIWPESESFSERGLPPVPEKFRGECVSGDNFTSTNCNRKIIGARFYYKGFEAIYRPIQSFNQSDFLSARDSDGHGTHTASIVAGSMVPNVSLYGMGKGTARGGAPSARLAIYKVCWINGECADADILAAFDDAISDGVDIISISLGGGEANYFTNVIGIGAFHAFQQGILVSASAGNHYFPSTVENMAPWMLTVAASSIDRNFQTNIMLGNSKILKFINYSQGSGLNRVGMKEYSFLIAGSEARLPWASPKNASLCKANALDPSKYKGKILVCQTEETTNDDVTEEHIMIKRGGGRGTIYIDETNKELALMRTFPCAIIGSDESKGLLSYMAKEKNRAVAKISRTKTVMNVQPAPQVAPFSSRGPNQITPGIIKPDVTAPGLNILAAWSPVGLEGAGGNSVNYNIIFGTSMSCPHITAIAAILKSLHPNWSSSALQSAIMTTASTMDNTRNLIRSGPDGTPATPFDFGSGHVNPAAAANADLVYEYSVHDILQFLCSEGASPAQLKNLTKDPVNCARSPPFYNFNYPSIGVHRMNGSLTVKRTVTYYGTHPTVYVAEVEPPAGVGAVVTPPKLSFLHYGEKKPFSVHFTPGKNSSGEFVFGTLKWCNGIKSVRSPIAINVHSIK